MFKKRSKTGNVEAKRSKREKTPKKSKVKQGEEPFNNQNTNQEESDLPFDIGIQQVDVSDYGAPGDGKSRISKIVRLLAVIILLGVVVFAFVTKLNSSKVDTDTLQSIPDDDAPSEGVDSEPEDKDLLIYGDENAPEEWEVDEEGKESENSDTPDGEESGEPIIPPYELPESYIYYNNGYLNLSISTPKTWYVTERTQDGFEEIRNNSVEGVFDLKVAELANPIPIADFSSSKEIGATIRTLIYPIDSPSVVGKPFIEELIPANAVVEGEVDTIAKDLGQYKSTITTYKVNDFGLILINTQVVVNLGNSLIVFVLSAEETDLYAESVLILEEMVKSVTLN